MSKKRKVRYHPKFYLLRPDDVRYGCSNYKKNCELIDISLTFNEIVRMKVFGETLQKVIEYLYSKDNKQIVNDLKEYLRKQNKDFVETDLFGLMLLLEDLSKYVLDKEEKNWTLASNDQAIEDDQTNNKRTIDDESSLSERTLH